MDQPIIRDPQFFDKADYVLMESTYGDRNHTEVWSYTDELAQIIDETIAKGGNVVIPSFAVGRTQELLYFIREIKDKGLVKSMPNFPVYVDSPLAKKATTIFSRQVRRMLAEPSRWPASMNSAVTSSVICTVWPYSQVCTNSRTRRASATV